MKKLFILPKAALSAGLFTLVSMAALLPARAVVTVTDSANIAVAASQVEAGGDTSNNPEVTGGLAGALVPYTETGSNAYSCCGGRAGTYGIGNLNDGDIGEAPTSQDGTFAIPDTGAGMVEITFDAGTKTIGSIAIYNGYTNRDSGTYVLKDGAGNVLGGWTIDTPIDPGSNDGVDSFWLHFTAPVTTDRLIIDGVIADCCSTPSFREIQVFEPSLDSDGDGMPDTYETANGLNPNLNDAAGDLDQDGLGNFVEFQKGTRADLADTDGDGLSDKVETGTGSYQSAADTGTNPRNPDTDGDNLGDAAETNTGSYVSPGNTGTNPFIADTDNDGFGDGTETSAGFDPNVAASNPAGTFTIRTAVEFQFYAAQGVSYRIEVSPDLQGWTTLESPIIGDGLRRSRFYTTENGGRRYYRLLPN